MAITKKEITEALHRGVRMASKNYGQWSNGLYLADAPEYLIVVEIARNIREKLGESEYLRLEMGYKDVLDGADVQGPGRPFESIKGGKRADVVLLKAKDKPTCVIEVKKNRSYQGLQKDLKRLFDVVYACRKKRGLLKHSFFLVYQSGDTEGVVQTVDKFFSENVDKAHIKRPSIRTWGRNDEKQASIVVEVTPAKS